MAIKNLPKYKDIRNSIRRKGRYPYVGTAVKDTIVIHHSLTLKHLKGSTPEAFANTHIDVNGWHGCAYPFVITEDGTIHQTDDLDRRTYHAGNTNTRSIGICVAGDFRKGKEKPSEAQKLSLYLLVKELQSELPKLTIIKGHQECDGYSWKNCPGDNWNYRDVINKDMTKIPKPVSPAKLPDAYVVQEDDTLWGISNELEGVTVDEIKQMNGLKSNTIYVGQVLKLIKESGVKHTVKAGDTLWGIARAYKGVEVADIKKASGITSDTLSIGQVLTIPTEAKKAEAPKPVSKPKPAPKPKPVLKPVVPSPYILPGHKGLKVTQLQKALEYVYFKVGTIDGSMGPKTVDALKRFQSIHSSPVDGNYGPKTRDALYREVQKRK